MSLERTVKRILLAGATAAAILCPSKAEGQVARTQGEQALVQTVRRVLGGGEGPEYAFFHNGHPYQVAAFADPTIATEPFKQGVVNVILDYMATDDDTPDNNADEKASLFGFLYHNVPEQPTEDGIDQDVANWLDEAVLRYLARQQGEAVVFEAARDMLGGAAGPAHQFLYNGRTYQVVAYSDPETAAEALKPGVVNVILDYHATNDDSPADRAQEKAQLFGFLYRNVSPQETEQGIRADVEDWLQANVLRYITRRRGEAVAFAAADSLLLNVQGVGPNNGQPRQPFWYNGSLFEVVASAEEHQETNRCFLPTTGIIIVDYRATNGQEPHNRAQDKAAMYGFSYRNVSPKETEAQIREDASSWLRTLYRDCVIGVEPVSWGEVKTLYR